MSLACSALLFQYCDTFRRVITNHTGLIRDLSIIVSEFVADDLHDKLLQVMIGTNDTIRQSMHYWIDWKLLRSSDNINISITQMECWGLSATVRYVSDIANICGDSDWLIDAIVKNKLQMHILNQLPSSTQWWSNIASSIDAGITAAFVLSLRECIPKLA